MTTTTLRTPHAVPYRDGHVMDLRFPVAPRRGDAPPRLGLTTLVLGVLGAVPPGDPRSSYCGRGPGTSGTGACSGYQGANFPGPAEDPAVILIARNAVVTPAEVVIDPCGPASRRLTARPNWTRVQDHVTSGQAQGIVAPPSTVPGRERHALVAWLSEHCAFLFETPEEASPCPA